MKVKYENSHTDSRHLTRRGLLQNASLAIAAAAMAPKSAAAAVSRAMGKKARPRMPMAAQMQDVSPTMARLSAYYERGKDPPVAWAGAGEGGASYPRHHSRNDFGFRTPSRPCGHPIREWLRWSARGHRVGLDRSGWSHGGCASQRGDGPCGRDRRLLAVGMASRLCRSCLPRWPPGSDSVSAGRTSCARWRSATTLARGC